MITWSWCCVCELEPDPVAGCTSCLEHMTLPERREVLRTVFKRRCGNSGSPNAMRAHGKGVASPPHLQELMLNLHDMVWPLREAAPPNDRYGHKFKVHRWMLVGKQVCRESFLAACGVSDSMLRTVKSFAECGVGPAALASKQSALRMCAVLKQVKDGTGRVVTQKRGIATQWWKRQLMVMDWMPNENCVVFRGPPWKHMHEQVYMKEVRPEDALSRKTWMTAREDALKQLERELPGARPGLACKRSARHSKFPECSECAKLRKRYLELAADAKVDPKLLKEAIDAMEAHRAVWSRDRELAINMRNHCFLCEGADTAYEQDDKCGSFWLQAPVDSSGRMAKDLAKAVYPFAIQGNIMCGTGGIVRLGVIPKNVKCGSNFGLTNLLIVLLRKKEKGGLPKKLIRHTDGGPDNVCWTTHVFHWLLVYLGVFDDLMWFRFDSGHSHTEVADRLFSCLKHIFERDDASRVHGVQDFVDLEAQVAKALETCKETVQLEFNFANFDFKEYFKNTCENDFHGYGLVNVFQYTYRETLWQHGGVHVSYKTRLSDEYAMKPHNEGTPLTTTAMGVLFVMKPPDLRYEPHREAFSDPKSNAKRDSTADDSHSKPTDSCKEILSKQPENNVGPRARKTWYALWKFHSTYGHAGQIPNFDGTAQKIVYTYKGGEPPTKPFLPANDDAAIALSGAPFLFKDAIQKLADLTRRPNINYNPFTQAPPVNWVQPAATAEPAPAAPAAGDSSGVQDHEVTHAGYKRTQMVADDLKADDHQWAGEQNSRLDAADIEAGKLYIVQLEVRDGEFWVGLVATKESTTAVNVAGTAEPGWECSWFGRNSHGFKWPKHVGFKPWVGQGLEGGETEFLPSDSFLLKVLGRDLTSGSKIEGDEPLEGASVRTSPCLNDNFMVRLRLFCSLHRLIATSAREPKERDDGSRRKATVPPARKRQATAAAPAAAAGAGAKRPNPRAGTSAETSAAVQRPRRSGSSS